MRLSYMLNTLLKAVPLVAYLGSVLVLPANAQSPAFFADPDLFEVKIHEVALCKDVTPYNFSCPVPPGFTKDNSTMRCVDPITIARGKADFDLASVPPGGEAGRISAASREIPAGTYRYVKFILSRRITMQGRVPQPGGTQDCITKSNGQVGTDANGLALYDTEGSLVPIGTGTPGKSTEYFEDSGICSVDSQALYTGLFPINDQRLAVIVEAPKDIVLRPGGTLPKIRIVVNSAGTLFGNKNVSAQGLPIGPGSPVPTWQCSMTLFDPIERQFSVEID
jgi:hypothetical protein